MQGLNEMDTIFIECDCHTELIQLTYEEPEMVADEAIDFTYLALYEYGSHSDNRFSWKARLQLIWYILRHGTPWKDQITLRTGERLKLTKYLNDIEERRQKFITDTINKLRRIEPKEENEEYGRIGG